MNRTLWTALAALSLSGCIYANYNIPLSFRSETRSDVGSASTAGDSHGEACANQILGIVAWGDGGYDAAYQRALAQSGATELFDVRSDTRLFNILGIYSQSCTNVTGKIAKR